MKLNKGKPKVGLLGEDGNVFNIIGKVRQALVKAGLKDKADEFAAKAFECRSYNEVLRLVLDYVEVEAADRSRVIGHVVRVASVEERHTKMLNALKVIALDPRISGYLSERDPKALEQVRDAIRSAEPIIIAVKR
jgi:hypothetical protein